MWATMEGMFQFVTFSPNPLCILYDIGLGVPEKYHVWQRLRAGVPGIATAYNWWLNHLVRWDLRFP
jgi:hypothetical protein